MTENTTLIETEKFHLKINTATSSIPVSDLLTYLSNYEAMAKSVNHVLNKNGCMGFDQVLVNIEAFNHGSFDIWGTIKKVTNNATFATIVGTVVSTLIVKAISTDTTPTTVINNYGGEVNINYDQLVENKELVKARSRIARTAVSDRHVESLSISYGQEDEELQTKNINMSTLESIIINEQEEPEIEEKIYSNVRLRIISPVLVSEPASWRVSFNDKKISAYMQDEDFLTQMNEKKIAFGMGDIIIADIEITEKQEEGKKPRKKYIIRKVHKYPHYSSDIENNSPTLFD